MLRSALNALHKATAPKRRMMEGASVGDRWPEPRENFGRVQDETASAGPMLRARALHLIGSNPYAANAVNVWRYSLVGAGITSAPSHPDEDRRKAITAAITRWAASAGGRGVTLYRIQDEVVRDLVGCGEAFVHMAVRNGRLRARIIPPELIDENDNREFPDGRFVAQGVEFSADGEAIAYHVHTVRPTSLWQMATPTIRIPAADMLHILRPMGAGQVRGMSWFAPVLLRLRELDGTEDAFAVALRMSASLAGFVSNPEGESSDEGAPDPWNGRDRINIVPGTLTRLPDGQKAEFNSPSQSQQAAEFLAHQIRAIAAGLGMPQYLLDGDARNANYSSQRGLLVAFRQLLESIQHNVLIPQLVQPLHERAIAVMSMSGDLEPGDFELDVSAEFYPPAQPWIDPKKDAEATAIQMAAGLMSRREAVAARGYDIATVDEEIAADAARAKVLGLNFPPSLTTESVDDDDDA